MVGIPQNIMNKISSILHLNHPFSVPDWIPLAFSGFALLGLFDALFLTWYHYAGLSVPCSVTSGCETVLSSQYAVWFGIPLALIGSLYYMAQFIGMTAYFLTQKRNIFLGCFLMSTIGFSASIVFVGIQLGILSAICTYCMLSAITSTILCALASIGIIQTSGNRNR
ncbi:MAG: hypothetical protein RIQ54_495 [Candidatus Parcubacteria bacterium]|jgi:uncharacterized membrane protein